MAIRAVGFDVDGTLYPNRSLYIRALPSIAGRFRFLREYAGVRKSIRRIRPIESFHALQSSLLAEKMKRGMSASAAAQLVDDWQNQILDPLYRSIAVYPYVVECLAALNRRGLKLGVLSDAEPERKLAYFGLREYFPCVISAEQVGYLKPNPEPFYALAECLDVKPDEILYIGNNYDYDVLGALEVGMQAAHRARAPAKNSRAHFTFSDYRDCLREITARC